MKNFFDIHLPLFSPDCPENQTEDTCVLRANLKQKGSVYSAFGYKLLPETRDLGKALKAVERIRAICDQCQKENKAR